MAKEGPLAAKSWQRLPEEALRAWRGLGYGMFIHYGMTTFNTAKGGEGHIPGPIERYNPTSLDVDQWVMVARDAGMKYAILTVKHGSAFCLWPTKRHRFNVSHSPVPVDVVGAFVTACGKYGVMPAFYISGESVEAFGDPLCALTDPAAREEAYMEHILGQVTELLTWYGPIGEMWYDGPGAFTAKGRRQLYDVVARLQPQAIVAMNGDFETNGMKTVVKPYTWPTDVVVIETGLPPFWPLDRFDLGEKVTGEPGEAKEYFVPCEVVTCMDNHADRWWFGGPSSEVRGVRELFAMRLLCHERDANLVLNVPPTPEGILRQDYVDALMKLRRNWETYWA